MSDPTDNTGASAQPPGISPGFGDRLAPPEVDTHTAPHVEGGSRFRGAGHVAPTQDGGGVTPPLAGLGAVLPERYVDQGVIGTGGMGEVHRVYDRVLNRSLAMKVMRVELAAHPVARGRFLREAQITAGLQHPGIVAVHDQGEVDGRLWYTMQEVRGQTFAALDGPKGSVSPVGSPAAGGKLRRRIEVLVRVAQAVGYAHRQGVIHRDLKPSNVMVGPFGEVLVLDWGLARRVEEGGVHTDPLGPGAPARVPRTASAFPAGEGARGPSGTPGRPRSWGR
jgi:serine/threonine protein kinase